jgi:hypothetical protein
MSDRNERIRDAFHDDTSATEWNRDGVLSGVLQYAHQVRRRRLYRMTAVALAATVVLGVGWVQLRSTPAPFPIPTSNEVVSATFDSIPTNPAEAAVTNQQAQGSATSITVHEAPQTLMPLLGHRSSLSNDLRELVERRDELTTALNANPGRERADQLRAQIAGTEADITSTRTALRLVDNQLAALQGETPVVVHEPVTFSESPPIVFSGPGPSEPFIWAAGISLTALLIVFAALLAIRRTMRSAVEALSSLQGQASSQMSALTSGIEAIAIEVERLGENQRFLSRAIAGEAKETVSPNAR